MHKDDGIPFLQQTFEEEEYIAERGSAYVPLKTVQHFYFHEIPEKHSVRKCRTEHNACCSCYRREIINESNHVFFERDSSSTAGHQHNFFL